MTIRRRPLTASVVALVMAVVSAPVTAIAATLGNATPHHLATRPARPIVGLAPVAPAG